MRPLSHRSRLLRVAKGRRTLCHAVIILSRHRTQRTARREKRGKVLARQPKKNIDIERTRHRC